MEHLNRLEKYLVKTGPGEYKASMNIEKIPDKAFINCDELVKLEIGSNIKEIGASAFRYCKNLTSITFLGDIIIGEYAFSDCKSLLNVCGDFRCKIIPAGAFLNCASLESISISDNKIISAYAFKFCKKLRHLHLKGECGGKIQEEAFAYCDELVITTNKNIVYALDKGAFYRTKTTFVYE